MKGFTVALLAIAVLCLCAAAQEMTADDCIKMAGAVSKTRLIRRH
jgi:hypothetical protein